MKKIFFSTIAIGVLLTNVNATSLKDVVEKTISNNHDILSEKFNKEAYQKYIDEEKGDYYPTLDFTGYIEESTTRLNRDNVATDPSKADKDGWNAVLQLEQILYDGGQTPSEVEEFRHRYNSNKFRSDRRVEEIIRDSMDSYLDLVKAQELMDISQHSLEVHDDYLIIAQEKEKISGEVLESYQVNSKKHFVIDRYLEQKIDKNEANNRFEELVQEELVGDICRPIIDEKFIPNSLKKIIEEAVRKNTKILEAIEKVKEQRENIVQANAANLPKLTFQWQLSWDNDLAEPENGREDINRLRLLVNWNLFEGGKNRIEKQREKLFLQEQQKFLDTTTQEVIREVKTAYINYYDKKAKVENIKRYVQDNKNIRDIYFKQLEDGTRTFIDILNAESEYFRSQIDAIEEEFELIGLYYDLLSYRNIMSDSILMSKKQVCPKFEGFKYKISTKKEDKEEEILDSDLLEEVSEETTQQQLSTDEEIALLLSGKQIPTEPKEVEVDEAAEKTNEKSEDEVSVSLPEGKYTINIASLDKEEGIDTFISNLDLQKSKVYTYNKNESTKILFGSFETLEEASSIMKKFSYELLKNGVYVDSLEKHRKILENLKTIN